MRQQYYFKIPLSKEERYKKEMRIDLPLILLIISFIIYVCMSTSNMMEYRKLEEIQAQKFTKEYVGGKIKINIVTRHSSYQ